MTRRTRMLRLALCVALALVAPSYAACGSAPPTSVGSPDASSPPTSETALEAGAEDGGCRSELEASADCVHPRVEKQCSAGFCRIPAGCFVSGSPPCQAYRGANTERETQVRLTYDFEIAEHETTQAEWMAMGYPNPSVPPSGANVGSCLEPTCPIGNVSWFEALVYANAKSSAHSPPLPACYELEGCTGAVGTTSMSCTGVRQTTASVYDCEGYRVPTDAEWEYAARAGSRDPYYSGPMLSTSNRCEDEPALNGIAWYCANSVEQATNPVAKKLPNAWGLYDMLGNVQELASDEYTGLPPAELRLSNPGALLGTRAERPKRGGSVLGWPNVVTASYRLGQDWNGRGPTRGFRLVRTLR